MKKLYFNDKRIIENVIVDCEKEGDFVARYVEFNERENPIKSFNIYGEIIIYNGDKVERIDTIVDVMEAYPVENNENTRAEDFFDTTWYSMCIV